MGDIAVDQGIASEFVKFLTAQLKESRDEVQRLNQVRFNLTGFFCLFDFSPLACLSRLTFSMISSGLKLRTDIAFSLPFMKWPLTKGCFVGRGKTRISIWGFARAKAGRSSLRKALENQISGGL